MSDDVVGMVKVVGQAGEKLVPIRHVVPDELTTLVSNHIVAQRESNSLCICFFEIRAPIVLDEASRAQAFKETKEVVARCVARVAVPREIARSLIDALRTQLDVGEAQIEDDDSEDAR